MHGMHFTNSHILTHNDHHNTDMLRETKKRSAGDQSLVPPLMLLIRRTAQAHSFTLLRLASLALTLTLTLTRASTASPHSKNTAALSLHSPFCTSPPLSRVFLPLVHSLTHSLTLSCAHWTTCSLLCRVSTQYDISFRWLSGIPLVEPSAGNQCQPRFTVTEVCKYAHSTWLPPTSDRSLVTTAIRLYAG